MNRPPEPVCFHPGPPEGGAFPFDGDLMTVLLSPLFNPDSAQIDANGDPAWQGRGERSFNLLVLCGTFTFPNSMRTPLSKVFRVCQGCGWKGAGVPLVYSNL